MKAEVSQPNQTFSALGKYSLTMFKNLSAYNKNISRARRWGTFFLQCFIIIFCTISSHAAEPGDEEVVAFFNNLEKSFLERNFSPIVKFLHKDFTYIMTYSTDGNFSYLESDVKSYRKNVGSFFLNKPNIYEYTITIDNIQRIEESIMVLLRIKSVVELYGIVNSCEASSNYHLLYIDNQLVVRDIRGDATCFNTRTN